MFFKTTKSLLKLDKEFQSSSYDALISHTTIEFTRYIVLSGQNRYNTDQRTIGGLFYELCDEVNELDWAVELQQLIELLQDALKQTNKRIKKLIQSNLSSGSLAFLVILRLICQFHSGRVDVSLADHAPHRSVRAQLQHTAPHIILHKLHWLSIDIHIDFGLW